MYFWDFKALPGDAAEKKSKGWAAAQEYVSQKSAEEDKATLYTVPFQIRAASGKLPGDLKRDTCSGKLVFWPPKLFSADNQQFQTVGNMLQKVAAAVFTDDVNCAECVLP